MGIKTTYTLEHDEVLHLLCGFFKKEYDVDVRPEELHLDLLEYRPNEGYTSGPDQRARINRVWFTR